jgi:hypothetical protein
MRTKIAQDWAAVTAEETTERVRPLLLKIVQHKVRETGSKMVAYSKVAAKIGGSASWLRKLLGRQPNVDLAAHQFLNILSLYRKLCERVEAEAENERVRLEHLWSETDASIASNLSMGSSPAPATGRANRIQGPSAA